MALKKTYPHDFERIYRAYPNWPKGRTNKYAAYKAYLSAKKEFDFSPADIDELVACIDRMKRERKTWQKGGQFGPVGLQVWFGPQRKFLEDLEGNYDKTRPDRQIKGAAVVVEETHEEAMAKIRQAEAERARLH